jgi:uncharacterized protein
MLFAIICIDKKGGDALRSAKVTQHLDYLHTGKTVKLAGPFMDASGNMNGSLLIVEAKDYAAAESWAAAEPFNRAGLFERVEIRGWFSVMNGLDPA